MADVGRLVDGVYGPRGWPVRRFLGPGRCSCRRPLFGQLREGFRVWLAGDVGLGDFIVWLLLGLVTFGIYTAWWTFSRAEAVYRATVDPHSAGKEGAQ